MRQTAKIAWGGVITALSVALMLMTWFPYATYALPALAGALTLFVTMEVGTRWAFGVYGVTALLSFLLAPDKEAALIYTLLLGYYPIAKRLIERLRSKILIWALKLSLFEAAAVGSFMLSVHVMGIPQESIAVLGPLTPYALLLLGTFAFLLYDIGLNRWISIYLWRIRPIVYRIFRH